jgi:gephyrin
MLNASLLKTPFAILSRPTCGIRNKTLIITLPGSPKACVENLEPLLPALGHAVELIRGGSGRSTHESLQKVASTPIAPNLHKVHACRHTEHATSGETTVHRSLSLFARGGVADRHRVSPFPMIEMNEALGTIADACTEPVPVQHPVNSSLVGMILAESVQSKEPIPGFRASIVDGYAVIGTYSPIFLTIIDAF